MSFSGAMIQNAIYIAQEPPEWPIAAEDWERAAEEKLDGGAFGYIAGGAGAEETMRANLEAFRRWRIRPRMLTGNASRDLSVDVLGMHCPAPFMLAPIGVLSIAHEEAEVGVGRAAASSGVPFIVSSAATNSLEEVAETNAPRWFQLYWGNDREISASFVKRAEDSGYGAIVLTLDTLTLGWRPRDVRGAYLPFLKGEGCGQYFNDPVFLGRLEQPPSKDPLTAAAMMLANFPNVGLTWDDVDWLRAQTSLPLLVKGVLTAADAELALQHGVDGIIVSNHGGRRGVEELIQNLTAELDLTLALAGAHSVRELDRS